MKYLILCCIPMFILTCTSETQKQQEQIKALETEVIRIHDDVMPKNADISRMRRAFKAMLQDSTLEASVSVSIMEQIKALNEAEAAMSNWMAEYKPPKKDQSFESAMEMLNNEKTKISDVSDLMLNSLKNGETLMTKIQQTD